jgi:mycothiol synthase
VAKHRMLREIRECDVAALTDVCIAGMRFDQFDQDLVREKTVGARDFVLSFSILEETANTIRGFIQGALGARDGKAHGWIRLLVVHPDFRKKGVGSALLIELEKRLREKGARAITTMDSAANYLSPGIDSRYTEAYSFLEKHGYERIGANLNLICDISPRTFDVNADVHRLATEGYIIRRAESADRAAVLAFLRTCFPFWEEEVLECFNNSPISLHICVRNGEVVGFSAYQGNNKSLPWFGPMGVMPTERAKGIGAIVCKLCLRDLALQGHKKSIIPWVGPVRFYSKVCNARIDRVFWVWGKELK